MKFEEVDASSFIQHFKSIRKIHARTTWWVFQWFVINISVVLGNFTGHRIVFWLWQKKWQKLRKIRVKKSIFAVVATDLPKTFRWIPHNVLVAKLSAYGFDRKSLIFISAHLKRRKQKARIRSALSSYLNILLWCSRRVHCRSDLVIIFLSDMFYICYNLEYASFADDTTPYVCRQNYAEPTINNIFALFKNNGLIANSVIFWLVRLRKLVWKY